MQDNGLVEYVECSSAVELLQQMRLSHPRWATDLDQPEWFFRGHSDASWELVPKVWRPDGQRILSPVVARFHSSEEVAMWQQFYQSPARFVHEVEREKLVKMTVGAETKLIQQFAGLANELGLNIGGEDALEAAQKMDQCPSVAMALAQHHGIPTSLLDWTRSPIVATHFASRHSCDSPIAVWAVRSTCTRLRERGVLSMTHVQRFECPYAVHSFLYAQSGVFTHVDSNYFNRLVTQLQRLPTLVDAICLDKRLIDEATKPVLVKFSLPQTAVPELRRLLWSERMSDAHLMPTFDNVAETVLSRWSTC